MTAAEILDELPRLTTEQLNAIRRELAELPGAGEVREVAGTGIRPPAYEALFGCLAHDPAFEIPERHRWRPALRFD